MINLMFLKELMPIRQANQAIFVGFLNEDLIFNQMSNF